MAPAGTVTVNALGRENKQKTGNRAATRDMPCGAAQRRGLQLTLVAEVDQIAQGVAELGSGRAG